jgi:HSP20 family protein
MYLSTLKPYRRPGSIRNEIDNLLHEFFGGPIHTGPRAETWLPPADISETEDRVFIKAELPGIEEKDIELTLLGNLLTIRGEKKYEREKDENHYLCDRYYESFRRTFQLPADINPDKAEANFDKGVLKISVAKMEEYKSKRIEINVE